MNVPTYKPKKKGPTKRQSIAQRLSGYSFGISPVILCLALVWPFGGGQKVKMMAGSETPAARGEITVKGSDNGNERIEIKASSLAKPSALTPPKNVYVVWLQEPDRDPQNLGALKVDNNQNADLETVTPYKRFKIFITAEQNPQERSPEGVTVLSADVPAL